MGNSVAGPLGPCSDQVTSSGRKTVWRLSRELFSSLTYRGHGFRVYVPSMIAWSWYALGVIIASFLHGQCKASSPKHPSAQWLSALHHNLCPESKLQISPCHYYHYLTSVTEEVGHGSADGFLPATFGCHQVMLFTSLRFSGEPGKDGCTTTRPGRSLLREAVHWRLTGFPCQPCSPESSLIPPLMCPRSTLSRGRFSGFGTLYVACVSAPLSPTDTLCLSSEGFSLRTTISLLECALTTTGRHPGPSSFFRLYLVQSDGSENLPKSQHLRWHTGPSAIYHFPKLLSVIHPTLVFIHSYVLLH